MDTNIPGVPHVHKHIPPVQIQVLSQFELPADSWSQSENLNKFSLSNAATNPQVRFIRSSTVKHLLDGSNFIKRADSLEILLERFNFDYQNPPHSYSYVKYLEMAELVRSTLYDGKSPDEGYEQLGYLAIQDYFEGVVGHILKATASLMGPQRGARQFLTKIKDTLRWGEHSFDEITANSLLYHIKYVPGPPAMMQGVLRASLEITGAKVVSLTSTVISEEDVIHEMIWS